MTEAAACSNVASCLVIGGIDLGLLGWRRRALPVEDAFGFIDIEAGGKASVISCNATIGLDTALDAEEEDEDNFKLGE